MTGPSTVGSARTPPGVTTRAKLLDSNLRVSRLVTAIQQELRREPIETLWQLYALPRTTGLSSDESVFRSIERYFPKMDVFGLSAREIRTALQTVSDELGTALRASERATASTFERI